MPDSAAIVPTATAPPAGRQLDEISEAVDRRTAQHDLEHDACDANDERYQHDDEVFEQHPERQISSRPAPGLESGERTLAKPV
jgi:hypothetical protein